MTGQQLRQQSRPGQRGMHASFERIDSEVYGRAFKQKLYKNSEGTVDCLLVYVGVEEKHEPIKSQCSVHLVSKPRERERIGEKDVLPFLFLYAFCQSLPCAWYSLNSPYVFCVWSR